MLVYQQGFKSKAAPVNKELELFMSECKNKFASLDKKDRDILVKYNFFGKDGEPAANLRKAGESRISVHITGEEDKNLFIDALFNLGKLAGRKPSIAVGERPVLNGKKIETVFDVLVAYRSSGQK